MKILIIGAAGFIGMHVAQNWMKRGEDVGGHEKLNSY